MFKNLRIGARLGIGFGMVLVLMAVIGIFSLSQMSSINQQSTDMAENWMPSIRATGEINTLTSDFRIVEYKHIVSDTPGDMAEAEKSMETVLASIKETRATYEKLISSPEEKAIYDEFSRQYGSYLKIHDQMLPLSRAMKTKEAMALMTGESQKLFDESSNNLLKLVALNVKGGEDASAAGDVAYAMSQKMVIGFIVIGVLVGMSFAFWIARSITRPLNEAVGVANQLAAGDLTARIEVSSKDETGMLLTAMQND